MKNNIIKKFLKLFTRKKAPEYVSTMVDVNIKVKDTQSGLTETITKKTANSYLITQTKRSKEGISSDNWFSDDKQFQQRFKILD